MSAPMPSAIDLHDPSSKAYKRAQRQYYKATKHRSNDLESEWTPFRAAEKRYKARFPPPDLSGVLDIAALDPLRQDEVRQGGWAGDPHTTQYTDLLLGLVIIPGFLSHAEQRDLVKWALADHAKFPNDTNLDAHYTVPHCGLWNMHVASLEHPDHAEIIHPRAPVPSTDAASIHEPEGPRKLINNTPATPETFATISSTPKPPPPPSPNAHPATPSELLHKMRWANIGWFYHWGVKQYDFSKGKADVDLNLKSVCKRAVDHVNWNALFDGTEDAWGHEGPAWKTWSDTYDPDAGIVNFYQTKDTLMAHVDRSEVCATSPLVSISLGNAAVFLIGDVVIMSGPVCRRAYHGVPRILEDTLPEHFRIQEEGWSPYLEYMANTRINLFSRPLHHLSELTLEAEVDNNLATMENDQGVLVDLYVPRKCSATNRLITSKDHASVQINVVDVDANGRALGTSTTFALCGQVRSQGESDDSLNRLATKAGQSSVEPASQFDSMVEIKPSDVIPSDFVSVSPSPEDDKHRLLYTRSKVYVHPTHYARDNIPGFVALVKREATNPTYLLAWIPETLLNEKGNEEWKKFARIEEHAPTEDEDDDVVFIDLPSHRPESYAFSVPLTSIYSLIIHPPSLSSWYGSIAINLINGDTLPTLHFHDDESRSFTAATPKSPFTTEVGLTSYPPLPSSPSPPPKSSGSWGGEDLLTRLRSYAHVLRSTLQPSLYLIDPSKADVETHTTQIFDDDAVDDILAQSSYANSYSPVPAHRRPRPLSPSMNPYSQRSSVLHRSLGSPSSSSPPTQARMALLQSFSNITRATRHAAQNILSHPLAKPIVPHLPDPVKSLVNANGETEWGSWVEKGGVGEFESARVYLARWARIVAEEGERARRREAQSMTSSQTNEAEETSLGVFELLHSAANLPTPKSCRDPTHPIDEATWKGWFGKDGRPCISKEEMKREVFQRGVTPHGRLRRQVWPSLLGVHEWNTTTAERAATWAIKKLVDIGAQSPSNAHVDRLGGILLTYNFYETDLGYVQGMSDLCAPIYVIMADDEEAEELTFWCFVEVMNRMKENFLRDQSGMKRHLLTLQQLIGFMDPELYRHLEKIDGLNLFFCFRWVLISFKREFPFDDVLKLWEVLWTDYYSNNFVLFVALAVLESHRDMILRYLVEFDEILKYCNELSMTIELDSTLAQAEVLFLSFSQLVADMDRRRAEDFDEPTRTLRQRGAMNAKQGTIAVPALSENLRSLLNASR
ncbi:hypothetical protein ONZ45_g2766 [Pleurotus djamor]|nr:hypothetical protein ONZ45_g2766 [Pleurotus djamor]